MTDQEIETLNKGYVCPPHAGPAWREASRYGFDMSLVEDSLTQSPEQRLETHQQALNMVLGLREEVGLDATTQQSAA